MIITWITLDGIKMIERAQSIPIESVYEWVERRRACSCSLRRLTKQLQEEDCVFDPVNVMTSRVYKLDTYTANCGWVTHLTLHEV